MMNAKQLSGTNINMVYNTLVGSVLVTSIIVMGNGAITIGNNYNCSGQIVNYHNEKTDVYTSFTSNSCISLEVPGYSKNKRIISGVEKVIINEDKLENLKKLEIISRLQDNWNANGAKALSPNLIAKVRNILLFLEIQPEIFPTACESLQLEYDKQDGSHMEIEVTENGRAEVFVIDHRKRESITEIQGDIESINKVVNTFYG